MARIIQAKVISTLQPEDPAEVAAATAAGARYFVQESPGPGARWEDCRNQSASGYATRADAVARVTELRASWAGRYPRIGFRIVRR